MKVCLVVCLGLAHLAAASIFKRHHERPVQALNLPLTYIDPTSYKYGQLLDQQQQLQYQRQKTQSEDRSQEHKYQDKNSQEVRDSRYNEYLNPETAEISSHEADEQIRVNIVEYQRPLESQIWNQRSALPISSYLVQEPQQYQRSSEEQIKHQPLRSSEEQMKYYQTQRSSEEQMNHYQAQLRSQEQYQPQYSKGQMKQYQKKRSDDQKYYPAVYGDNVEWSGIRMAVGPHSPIAEQKDIEYIFADAYNTVKDFTEEEKKTFHQIYLTAAENEDTHLNVTQLLQKHQYAVEEHTVKTDDGYILTLFRIPPKQKTRDVQKRPVVFLMHGLLGSADDWVLSGPGVGLAYLLADADYDVWMGNARGNKYSRRHVSKHPAQPDFWQFSNDEIALHDLPAMIDYALNTTHQEKMYYVGFSEGTTTFFALASSLPVYNDKIIMMYALSPMVYMSHTRSPLLKMIAPNSQFYERLHQILGHSEFKPTQEVIQTFGGDMMTKKFGCKHVASNVNLVMSGMVDNYDPKIVPMIVSHLPAGASTRQIKQYGQAVATTFRRYDYGPAINMKVYGSEQPPKYQMSAVRVPVTLYYSTEDWLAQPADVEQLRSELPHADAYQVPQFSHLDFQFSKNAPEAVYQRLIASIEKNQEQKQQYQL
ncbi:lipase 3-like [Cydia pomonella]|uniref:lipase 3-like n=1 Tax=Cydia pomonella TaxID=82600 RepID=UPI002ADDF4EB|nr:lipase 3-like [Cydia pomonella]